MRNTVLHIRAKVHPATASISVKFRAMKEDIDISKSSTSHFRISYLLEIFALIVDLTLT